MSLATAKAFSTRELEKDSSPARGLTVKCFACDPDNPRSVPRSKCPACRGRGRTAVAAGSIASEIRSSRLELLTGGKKSRRPSDEFDD